MDLDKIIDQIKKCVRLANRTTEEGERATALRLAKNLADKNGIALDDIEVGESDPHKAVMMADDEYKCWDGCEMGYAYYILDKHFGVIVMLTPDRLKRYKKRHTWIGSPLNIDIAKHVLHVLLRECRKAYREEQRKPNVQADTMREMMTKWGGYRKHDIAYAVERVRRKSVDRNSFMRGFFYAIDEKLTAHPLRNDVASDAAEAKRKLDEYKKEHTVNDQKMRNSKTSNSENLMAGIRAANAVNLARPCDSNGISPLALSNAVDARLTA